MTTQSSAKNTTWQRWQEIIKIWHEEKLFFQVFTALIFIGIGVLIGSGLFAHDSGYSVNIYTEILSVFFTIFVLNLLQERREEHRRIEETKERLIRGLRSYSRETVMHSLSELHEHDWLRGDNGLLAGGRFISANLDHASLIGVNCQNSNLSDSNLQNASLAFGNFREANLSDATLQGADLQRSKLQNTDLRYANLDNAVLARATLLGANLLKASLKRSKLENAVFDQTVMLPNGEYWTPETDMKIFTDPNHPNFWRSDDPHSPAYRGDE